MKTIWTAIIAVISVLIPFAGFGQSQIPATMKIDIITYIAPYNKTTAAFNNAINGILTGTAQGIPGTPEYFAPYTNGTLSISSMISTPDFKSWLGKANPTGPVAQENGNMVQAAYDLSSSAPFRFNDIWIRISSPFNNFSGTFGALGVQYTGQAIGINWGADGQFGGGDDIYFGPGSENALVNQVVGIGIGFSIQSDYSDGSTPQLAIDNAILANGPSCPYDQEVEFGANGTTKSMKFTVVVPEPTSATLFATAIGASLFFFRRKREV